MLRIGIIGNGFVGKAMHHVFKYNAVTTIVDPAYTTNTTNDLYGVDVIFVCLPAPTLSDGSVDASLIYDVFNELDDLKYRGIIVVKSTLPPYIVDDLQRYSGSLKYIYSPEFLRELFWETDALTPGSIILAGNYHDCDELRLIYKRHSHVVHSTEYIICDYKEASLAKYAINSFLAIKVVFMNQLFELYSDIYPGPSQPESWNAFMSMMASDGRIGESHLMVPGPDRKYGYGGTCFPKDVKAMNGFDVNGRMTILKEAELANTRIRLSHKE